MCSSSSHYSPICRYELSNFPIQMQNISITIMHYANPHSSRFKSSSIHLYTATFASFHIFAFSFTLPQFPILYMPYPSSSAPVVSQGTDRLGRSLAPNWEIPFDFFLFFCSNRTIWFYICNIKQTKVQISEEHGNGEDLHSYAIRPIN